MHQGVDPLLNVGQDPFQFVQAVVAHDQLSLASGRVLERHLGPQFIGKFALQTMYVRIHRPLRIPRDPRGEGS